MKAPAVQQRNDVSLYKQVESILRSRLSDGRLRPGDKMPGEDAIKAEFGVSRATVRQALDILENDGLIERHAGRGTFVRESAAGHPPPAADQMAILSILDSAQDMGVMISHGLTYAPAHVLASLGVATTRELPFLIHVVEPRPGNLVAMQHYLIPELADALEDIAKVANYTEAAKIMGGDPIPTELGVEAILAEPRFAHLLKTEVGTPLLSIWWTRLRRGAPITRSQALLKGGATTLGFDR